MTPHSQTNTISGRSRTLLLLPFLLLMLCLAACAKRSRSTVLITEPASSLAKQQLSDTQQININTASAKELEALPGIGEGLAERILEHRKRYGPFRRAEHLMMVRGISEARFRALRDLITVK